MNYDEVKVKVAETLIKAASTFKQDKMDAYKRMIEKENNPQAKWVLETILENAVVASENRSPLCDDTGIPHLYLELGSKKVVTGMDVEAIYAGIREGLRKLPGRPMAIMGNDEQRIEQSGNIDSDPAAVLPAPIQMCIIEDDVIRLSILMEGGGPAIRGKDYRVFHKHNLENVVDEVVLWASEAVAQIGCSPCTLAIGIGRSHYEAAAMMMQAQVEGNYNKQSKIEKEITDKVNRTGIGALGLKGDVSVIGTFVKVGPQRASGVRIVCMRPCCCFEPRVATVELE